MQGLRLGQEASLHGAYGKPTQTHRIMIAKEKAGVDTHQARLLGRVLVEQAGHSRTQHKLEKKKVRISNIYGPYNATSAGLSSETLACLGGSTSGLAPDAAIVVPEISPGSASGLNCDLRLAVQGRV